MLTSEIAGAEEIDDLVAQYNEINATVETLSKEKDQLREAILEIVESAFPNTEDPATMEPVKTAETADGSQVTYVAESCRDSLDRVLLVKAGVTPEQLRKGTKTSPVKASVRIVRKKGQEGEGAA